MTQDGKISIIIPVYNNEKFLEGCLDSVINQTYRNIEVILVDDGSEDSSGKICDEYCKKDCRIKVIHKKNEGASVARNMALDIACGEYVGFVDSDDTIDPRYYEIMLDLLKEKDVDAVLCNLWLFECPQDKVFENILCDRIGGQITKWLFKMNLWDGIRMPAGRLVQDAAVIYKVIYKARTYMFNQKLYHYFDRNPNNVSNSKKNLYKGAIDRSIMFIDRYNWLEQTEEYNIPDIKQEILGKIISFGIGAFGLYKQYDYNIEDIEKVRNFFLEHKREIKKSRQLSRARKYAIRIICISPRLFYLFRRFCRQ